VTTANECQTLIKTIFDARRFKTASAVLRGVAKNGTNPFTSADMLTAKDSLALVEDVYAISGFFYNKKFVQWIGADLAGPPAASEPEAAPSAPAAESGGSAADA